jgi:hypothetical protein
VVSIVKVGLEDFDHIFEASTDGKLIELALDFAEGQALLIEA